MRASGGFDLFNVVALGYDVMTRQDLWRDQIARTLDFVDAGRAGLRVLDLGCGPGVSAFALGYMASARFSYRRLAVAGPVAGLGVSVMHFMGMASMSFGGYLEWNGAMVLLAVLIAVVAASAALWLAFHVRRTLHRVAAAFVMAAAVCAMHYTGMAAADVVCTTASRFERMHGLLYGDEFRVLVIVVALGAAIIVAFDVFMQRVTARGMSVASQ